MRPGLPGWDLKRKPLQNARKSRGATGKLRRVYWLWLEDRAAGLGLELGKTNWLRDSLLRLSIRGQNQPVPPQYSTSTNIILLNSEFCLLVSASISRLGRLRALPMRD
jgi:hypothetical protein